MTGKWCSTNVAGIEFYKKSSFKEAVRCGTHGRPVPASDCTTPAHTGLLSTAPQEWCLFSWWQYASVALHILWCPPPPPPIPPPPLRRFAHSLLPLACQEINRWNKCEVIAAPQSCVREDEIAAGILVVVVVVGVGVSAVRIGGLVWPDWMSLFRNDPHFITRATSLCRKEHLSFSEYINVLTRLHRRKTTTISVLYVRIPSKQMQVQQEQRSVHPQRLSQLTRSAFLKQFWLQNYWRTAELCF